MVVLYALLLWLYVALADVTSLQSGIAVGAFTSLLTGAYLINKYFNVAEDTVSQPGEARSSAVLFWVALGCMFVPMIALFFARFSLAPYAFFALISLGYSVPMGGFRIKSIPLIKNLYAAGSWWASVVVILAWYGNVEAGISTIMLETLFIFFIALTYELLWDVRDMEGDHVAGHRTIPTLFGILPTKIFMIVSLAIAWYLSGLTTFPLTLLMLGFLGYLSTLVRPGFPPAYYHASVYVLIAILSVYIIGI